MEIIIGADIVPTNSNVQLFSEGKTEELIGSELVEMLTGPNTYTIFNLEVPLSDIQNPISKFGPNLIAPSAAIEGYKALNINLLTLANNHILDHGEQGLNSTINLLDQNGIGYLGAGQNVNEAAKSYLFAFSNKTVGVYACAEHEFSIADREKAGANPFDPLESPDHVRELKQKCDYVIVLYHGGKEHYRYPSPNLQKNCRKLVDCGANLVVCQHSHCIGCEEKYKDATIVYGQGNFLFDATDIECWLTSLLIQIDEEMNVTYIPLVKQGNGVRLASGDKKQEIIDAFYDRSKEIATPGVIEQKHFDFSKAMFDSYLYRFSGHKSVLFRMLNKVSGQRLWKWYLRSKYRKNNLVEIRNVIECETHRELFLYMLEKENV